jgi:hypothetical protein
MISQKGYAPIYGVTEMIAMLGTVGLAAAKTMLLSMLTERMVLKLTLTLLEWAADRTTNEVDNTMVNMMRSQLQKTGVI